MKKIAILLATLLLALSPAYADLGKQEFPSVNYAGALELAQASLPEAGILPGSPLYFLKRLSEGIRETVTFGKEKKIALHLEFARTRLAEANALSGKGKNEEALKTVGEFSAELGKAMDDNETTENAAEMRRNLVVLTAISEKAPESAKAAIEKAINRTAVKINIARKTEEGGNANQTNPTHEKETEKSDDKNRIAEDVSRRKSMMPTGGVATDAAPRIEDKKSTESVGNEKKEKRDEKPDEKNNERTGKDEPAAITETLGSVADVGKKLSVPLDIP